MADWKAVVRGVAPAVGRAIGATFGGGPAAAVGKAAVEAVARVVAGKPDASESEIASAIDAGLTSEQVVELQKLDRQFELRLAELDVELAKVDATDRDSARKMQTETHDWTPRAIALIVLATWASIQYALLFWRVPDTNRDLITRSLGTLEAIVLMVIGFYFGYSHWARTQKRQEGHT